MYHHIRPSVPLHLVIQVVFKLMILVDDQYYPEMEAVKFAK
jgi:hypothetical protein